METVRIREPGWKKVGSGIRDKHPGSATLVFWMVVFVFIWLLYFLPTVQFFSVESFLIILFLMANYTTLYNVHIFQKLVLSRI